jgi:hypothetical protein
MFGSSIAADTQFASLLHGFCAQGSKVAGPILSFLGECVVGSQLSGEL